MHWFFSSICMALTQQKMFVKSLLFCYFCKGKTDYDIKIV